MHCLVLGKLSVLSASKGQLHHMFNVADDLLLIIFWDSLVIYMLVQ